MKKINYILTLLIITLISALVTGCGSKEATSIESLVASGDLEAIRAKKKELANQQKTLEKDIATLDSAIGQKVGDRNLPLVTIHQVGREDFIHYVELQGDVTTRQNVLIYPEMSGTLLKVHVTKGQGVKRGQVLGTIDDGGMQSQLLQMQTQLALAKTTYERQEKLWEQNIGSEIQYLQTKANYEAQENAVAQMKKQLDKFLIRAPFSGIIDDVIKDQGTVVSPGPGSEVFRIVNLSNMYIEVDVPETYITSIVPGKKVNVFFPILNETIQSKVNKTGNFINPNNRSFTVEIPVPNKGGKIKPNLTAKVQINDYRNKSAILIPQSVISENAEGDQYVFIAKNINDNSTANAERKIISSGKTQGDIVEVLDGLEEGESIIVEGARSVKEGQKIKILTE